MGTKKISHEEFVRQIKEINSNIDIISQYTGSQDKIKCYCKIHKCYFEKTGSDLKRRCRCPECGEELNNQKRTFTHEKFLEELYKRNKYADQLEILDEYKKNDIKIKVRCKECGYEWFPIPSVLLNGAGCKICNTKNHVYNHKKSYDEFIKEFEAKGLNIELISDYITMSEPIKARCKDCGYEWDTTPSRLRNAFGCPKCIVKINGEKHRLTNDNFLFRMKDIHPNIEVLEEYVTSQTKVKCKCLKCGYEFSSVPASLLSGYGCLKCGNAPRKTTDVYKEEVKSLVGDEFVVCGEYINCDSKIRMYHTVCNKYFDIPPTIFLMKHKCPNCAPNARVSEEEFKKRIIESIGDNYELISEFKNTYIKVNILHKTCGKTYWVRPSSIFLKKSGCPYCCKSKGEDRVESYLKNNCIEYEIQKKFDDCRDKRRLPFDFYLPQYNTCIEYDGELHYLSIDYFGGKKSHDKVVIHDNIKTQYCKENNISLIRIPYWDYDKIEDILTQKLN